MKNKETKVLRLVVDTTYVMDVVNYLESDVSGIKQMTMTSGQMFDRRVIINKDTRDETHWKDGYIIEFETEKNNAEKVIKYLREKVESDCDLQIIVLR